MLPRTLLLTLSCLSCLAIACSDANGVELARASESELTSTESSAISCYEYLRRGGDSSHHAVAMSEITPNDDWTLDEETADQAVRVVLKRHAACDVDEEELTPARCGVAVGETLCKVEARSGYFLVVKDYVDTLNVIFNRWD